MHLHSTSFLRSVRLRRLLGTSCLLALASCSSNGTNPIDWWHGLEGGRIADERPPAPNADAPYPNLASVPARPAPSDSAARGAIANALVADRSNAQYAAGLNPLPAAPSPAARPAQPTPRPADDSTSGATLPAAAAPPPRGPLGPPQAPLPNVPVTAPRRAPTQAVQSAALPPPADRASAPSAAAVSSEPRPADPVASLPPIPDAPPPPPNLSGAPKATAPTPPPVAPPPPPPKPVVVVPGAPVLIGFPAGSATLPVDSLAALKILTRQRGDATIEVTGYGEANGSDANAQSAALPLAFARARAIAANLLAAGVPSAAIRVNAEAQGRGGAARLQN